MKIAQIVCAFPPYHGGMGNVACETSTRLLQQGHDVQVFTPKYDKDSEGPVFDFVNRVKPVFSYGNSAYLPHIKEKLSDFDIVHLHYPFFGVANLVRKWKKDNPSTPLVITYHMDARGDGLKSLIFKTYRKLFLDKILSSADVLLAGSLDYIKYSQASDFYRKNKNKWRELPFGVDTEKFKPEKQDRGLFKQLDLDPDKKTLLFVGGMDQAHYFKGVPVLLEAISKLRQGNFDVQAIFVGGGELRAKYVQKAKKLDIKSGVRFAGFVSDGELPKYYNSADLTVLPSINQSEAFGIVLVESMATGTPVLASNLPGVRSVAKNGGFVVQKNDYLKLANKIRDIFESKKLSNLSKKTRKLCIDKYSWNSYIDKLEEVYEYVV